MTFLRLVCCRQDNAHRLLLRNAGVSFRSLITAAENVNSHFPGDAATTTESVLPQPQHGGIHRNHHKITHPNGLSIAAPAMLKGIHSRFLPSSFSKRLLSSSKESESPPEQLPFQAETRRLLEIVTHSLYTDKDVFLRELVSNASDALEKVRLRQQLNDESLLQPEMPLEIHIELDEVTSSLIIRDTGIGMTKDEMINNLGTIAKSGTLEFVKQDGADARDIIGKFGVGFYSAFMVGDKVEVRSRSGLHSDDPGYVWTCDMREQPEDSSAATNGNTFTITPLDAEQRQERGTSIQIYLTEENWHFCDERKIGEILKKYSHFVSFPIHLNGTRVNTIQAIWTRDPKEVSDEDYSNFYKYLLPGAMDEPLDVIHFRTDAPLDIKALWFIPSFHSEKFGNPRMTPGVALYSRKVLIDSKPEDLLPDWMRFVKGVVDCEDLPLSLSRETPQDSALIKKLKHALTRKFISHLTKMAKDDKSKYVAEFYREYSFFIKEGICQEYDFQGPLSKLLYFETSKQDKPPLSLDEYISRMTPEQDAIYYLCAPTREAALQSPYLEAFEAAGIEVILMFTAIEDFVMANLEKYEGRPLVSVEKAGLNMDDLKKKRKDEDGKDEESKNDKETMGLSTKEAYEFCDWFRNALGSAKIDTCKPTERLTSSPAIVTDSESGAVRRMMRLVDTSDGNRDFIPLPKQHVEVNPHHDIIVGINQLRQGTPDKVVLAKTLAEQVYDNCLVAAGLLDDGRSMLPRINDLLLCVVQGAATTTPKGGGAAAAAASPISWETKEERLQKEFEALRKQKPQTETKEETDTKGKE